MRLLSVKNYEKKISFYIYNDYISILVCFSLSNILVNNLILEQITKKRNSKTTIIMEIAPSNQRKGLPRSLQFQRMERIVKAMQHPTAGVPVRSQKLFLTTVPNAFTGNDISEWIMQKLNVKDSSKSLRLNE